MKNAFSLLGLMFVLAACGSMPVDAPDAAPCEHVDPAADAAPADAAAPEAAVETDTRPAADARTSPALSVEFAGPAGRNVRMGSQEVTVFRIVLRAFERIEVQNLGFRLVLAHGRLVGSEGTPYLSDLKLKDVTTGATVMGPVTLRQGYEFTVSFQGESFTMEAGEARDLILTADLANHEDAPGEFIGTEFGVVSLGSDRVLDSNNVRRLSNGTFVPAEEILGNQTFVGNHFTIIGSRLSVSLAASPATHIAVKNAPLEPSAGLVFTANPWSDLLVRSVTLTGQGNVSGAYRREDLRGVVTSCALFDGPTQVGLAQSPGYDGRMVIGNMNLVIPHGTSRTLIARCFLDSVVAQNADAFSIGIASAEEVVVEDDSANMAQTDLASGVIANATGAPVQYVAVRAHGDLAIELDPSTPASINILAGNEDCWPLAIFRATTTLEGARITRIRVGSVGDAALYRSIAVFSRDAMGNRVAMLGQDTLQAGIDQSRDVMLTTPLDIAANSTAQFELCAVTARLPFDTAGHLPIGLGIVSSNTVGEWDSSYVDTLNVRADGTVSDDRLHAAGPALFGNVSLLF